MILLLLAWRKWSAADPIWQLWGLMVLASILGYVFGRTITWIGWTIVAFCAFCSFAVLDELNTSTIRAALTMEYGAAYMRWSNAAAILVLIAPACSVWIGRSQKRSRGPRRNG